MPRKLILFFALCAALMGGAYFLVLQTFPPVRFTSYCAFCDPAVLERQAFYEDELVLALYTHKPVLPGHCLVIPKRHVERFENLTEAEITHMGRVLKKVDLAAMKVWGTSSYLLLQKNGREVGQSVPHVHFHYIPRKAGDGSAVTFLFNMCLANLKKPLSAEEVRPIVEKMREAMLLDHAE